MDGMTILETRAEWEKQYSEEDPYGVGGRWISEQRRILNSFKAIPKGRKFDSALDLCSGEGHFTLLLTDIASSVTAIELSGNAVARARKRLVGKPVELQQADVSCVDFPPNSFDLICAVESLRYLKDKKAQVAKWSCWLRDGGILLATGPILPGYFRWDEFIGYFSEHFTILKTIPVTSKLLIAKLANRHLIPFPQEVYDLSTRLATLFPRLLTKHLAVVAEKKKA
jgi:ubiquinone/menaquinone biosynthesis C-methylase UbiE